MRRLFICLLALVSVSCSDVKVDDSYVVAVSRAVAEDKPWADVAEALRLKHSADVVVYESSPCELLDTLRSLNPRYVAIVEKPENIGRDYVISFHHTSRDVDEDIYADFMWGIITGYDAEAAMRMVDNSTEPLLIKDAVATIMELNSAKWFDNYAWVDDHTKGLWGEKRGRHAEIKTDTVAPEQVLRKFTDLYAEFDPDLIVTAAHATQKNLEMPYSLGNLKPRGGKLYAEDRFTQEEWDLRNSGKRRVYAAVGNCLIGDMNNTKESMAAAWLSGSNASTMIGYVVTTWHGRNGWGALKYWVTNPSRYTLAEAVYINQQDFLHQQNEWYPQLINEKYRYEDKFMEELTTAANRLSEVLGREIDLNSAEDWDMVGFWHDRDVLVYYGDPKWQINLQSVAGDEDYSVEGFMRDGKYVVKVVTGENFSLEKMRGDKFKQEHVLDLPFSYIFPKRLSSPRLAEGQEWEVALDENFVLVYNAEFEPNSVYEIVIDVE
jgi:zinc protease